MVTRVTAAASPMASVNPSDMAVVQIGLNTADMPGSLRLYAELFGFAHAGSNAFWGPPSAIQGLGPNTRGVLWWLVGRQRFFQLELFQHTVPRPQALPQDWRPCDHGWVRFGIAVTDFQSVIDVLARWHIPLLSPVVERHGLRRAAFRDPFVGVIVECLEDGAALPGGVRQRALDFDPAFIYATSSVADLDSARNFYRDVLGLTIEPREILHSDADEAVWGLAGAKLQGFLARAGDYWLEVVAYSNPAGRPRRQNYCVADQGIMNVALGSRHYDVIDATLNRVKQAGIQTGMRFGKQPVAAQFLLDAGREIELIALPEALDAAVGFTPVTPFFGTTSL